MEQEQLASLYVDPEGFLMCGEPTRSTSMVEGCRFLPFNIDYPSKFDYEIKFINDMKWLCNGYDVKKCSIAFQYKS